MRVTHINHHNHDYTYTNATSKAQNVFIVAVGGDGNINYSTYDHGHSRYYHGGAMGVSLQVFINGALVETIAGGGGSVRTLADQYIHVRTDHWREKYRCGFLNLKTCWRDHYRDIWEWGHRRRSTTRAQSGATKSFVLNLPRNAELRVKFIGFSASSNKGRISLSVLEQTLSLPLIVPPSNEEAEDLTE